MTCVYSVGYCRTSGGRLACKHPRKMHGDLSRGAPYTSCVDASVSCRRLAAYHDYDQTVASTDLSYTIAVEWKLQVMPSVPLK